MTDVHAAYMTKVERRWPAVVAAVAMTLTGVATLVQVALWNWGWYSPVFWRAVSMVGMSGVTGLWVRAAFGLVATVVGLVVLVAVLRSRRPARAVGILVAAMVVVRLLLAAVDAVTSALALSVDHLLGMSVASWPSTLLLLVTVVGGTAGAWSLIVRGGEQAPPVVAGGHGADADRSLPSSLGRPPVMPPPTVAPIGAPNVVPGVVPAAVPPVPGQARMTCPECAESIAVGARRCRFCGFDLEAAAGPPTDAVGPA